jgi:glycosyltransferase involved in cell wall biosynthesis
VKIVFDYQIFFWQRYGGISTYFSNLAKNICALNNEVKIVSPFYTNELINNNCFLDIVIGRKIKNIPRYTNKFFRVLNNILFEYYIKKIDPQIIHLTYYDKIFNLNKKKKILTVYDLIHEKFILNNYKNNNFPKKRALEEADQVICISESTRKDLLDIYSVDKKKIKVIYLASSFSYNQNSILINKTPSILYVGDRARYKNFYNFVKSISNSKLLKNKVNINCFGSNLFSKQELTLFSNEGFQEGIFKHIIGDNDVLKSLYLSSTVLVYPSLYEGFGLPILEAMSLGCPVICSNTSSMREIGADSVRYFDPNNIDDMTTSIEEIISSEEDRNILAKKGFERNKNFSWTKCAQETLAIYNNVI